MSGPLVTPLLAPQLSESSKAGPRRSGLPHRASVIALVVGLVVTAVLASIAFTAKDRNNYRLLGLQTQESATVIGSLVSSIQTPLASAAEVAQTTNGDVASFKRYIAPDVGPTATFKSVSLWDVRGATPVLRTTVGLPSLLVGEPAQERAFLAQAEKSSTLSVGGLLDNGSRILYGFSPKAKQRDFVIVAENTVPPGHYAPIARRSAFSDLNFALYLGTAARKSNLLEASVHQLPLPGPTYTERVPFGDSYFTFVASANGQLGGTLSEDIWWLIAVVGAAMTIGAGVLSERLVRSRLRAQEIANENGRLYAEQRGVAETLQHTLLPQDLPELAGLELAVRYVPGVEDLNIGGDWYDVLLVGDDRILFVVGDVSGRGLRAASHMAALRFATRAYALQGDPPAVIFEKLGQVLNISRDQHFATAICALVDIETRELQIVNAGHPNGVLRSDTGTVFLDVEVGPPIGVSTPAGYVTTTMQFPRGATLLGFTDGLVERRGESLDTGMARIRDLVAGADAHCTLDELMNNLINELAPSGPNDDIALLGMKWN
jgi:serine phosphatase RsbU (regulator of sigma subunit)